MTRKPHSAATQPHADTARHICGIPKPGEVLIARAGFDRFESDALFVMRHVFLTMQPNPSRAGADPYAAAETAFDGRAGIELATALVALVQTMAMGRSAGFSFSNPYCAGCAGVLTGCERHLLSLLHLTRRGAEGRAMVHALMLCDRAPAQALLAAAHEVARRAPHVRPFGAPADR
ncbi:hypothetical protein [Actibacterium sp. D379-3]